jgi:hypothetical protein
MAREIEMIKGSEIRKADHPIESLLLDRWSPRAMSGEEIPQEELMRLFEAALGSIFIQRPAMARALRPPRHRALADVLRFARRREQNLGEERRGPDRVHFEKAF